MITILLNVYGVVAAALGSYNLSKFLVRRAVETRRKIISDAEAKQAVSDVLAKIRAVEAAVENGQSLSEDIRGAVAAIKGDTPKEG